MANLHESEAAYDRHDLHTGVMYSDVADVILKLETEIADLRIGLAAEQAARSRYEQIEYVARAVVAAARDVLDNAAPVEHDVHAVPDMQIARLDRAVHEATKGREPSE